MQAFGVAKHFKHVNNSFVFPVLCVLTDTLIYNL